MPTLYHTNLMSTDAEVSKFFHTPIGTLPTPAVLTREVFDGTSALRISFGTETPNHIFAGNGGGTAYADMVAAAGTIGEGHTVECYSTNPVYDGRWQKLSGVLVKQGAHYAKGEDDGNHMRAVKDLNLWLQTGYNTAHPLLVDDGPLGSFVDKVAYPNVTDMTNHIMRITARAVDFSYPIDYHLGMHLQAELLAAPMLGTGNFGAGAYPLVNAMNRTNILGILGSGASTIYDDNTTQYIADSGWTAIDIVFSPNDSQWTMMAGNVDKDAHEQGAYNKSLYYIASSAKVLVGAGTHKLNSYLCGFRWNTRPGIPTTNTPRPRQEPTGKLFISKIEFFSP